MNSSHLKISSISIFSLTNYEYTEKIKINPNKKRLFLKRNSLLQKKIKKTKT
ncbi:hypothetical protein RCH33_807 [Flavobacterium daejeonense]|nr:hypothetical protein RCH33_807 [Flavobacterium daejeonense]